MNYSLNRSRQHGTALLISMIILLVMTMVVLQGARSANLELLIGNNSEYAAEALAMAEDGIEAGESNIEENFGGAPAIDYGTLDTDGVYLDGQISVDSVDWSGLNYESSGGYTTEGGSVTEEYDVHIIEYLGPAFAAGGSLSVGAGVASDTRYIYRISGRGLSDRGGARVIQTVYATAE
jgi:hypothetical protein